MEKRTFETRNTQDGMWMFTSDAQIVVDCDCGMGGNGGSKCKILKHNPRTALISGQHSFNNDSEEIKQLKNKESLKRQLERIFEKFPGEEKIVIISRDCRTRMIGEEILTELGFVGQHIYHDDY